MGYLFITQDYHTYTMDILTYQPDLFLASLCSRLWSIQPPFGQGGLTTPSPFLLHIHLPLTDPQDKAYPSQSTHWLTSWTLLPFLPDSLATSVQPGSRTGIC